MRRSRSNEKDIWYTHSKFGELAQLGERLHGMEEVRGSSPLFSTNEHPCLYAIRGAIPFHLASRAHYPHWCAVVLKVSEAVPSGVTDRTWKTKGPFLSFLKPALHHKRESQVDNSPSTFVVFHLVKHRSI